MTNNNNLDDDSEAPNDNCLRGLRCPQCKSWEPLLISTITTFEVYDCGVESHHSPEWDDDSACQCPECNFIATVRDFRYPVPPLLDFTRRVFANGENSVES